MKFDELKKSAEAHPKGLSDKEELAWRCMNYLNALFRFGHIDAKQVKQELGEIEYHFLRSLSPHEKVMQELAEGGNALSVAYHLMALQPEREKWQGAMTELLRLADRADLAALAEEAGKDV